MHKRTASRIRVTCIDLLQSLHMLCAHRIVPCPCPGCEFVPLLMVISLYRLDLIDPMRGFIINYPTADSVSRTTNCPGIPIINVCVV